MKITIDTSTDSHSEIKKVIRMLSHLVGDEVRTNEPSKSTYEDSSPAASSGDMFSMFDAPKEEKKQDSLDDEDVTLPIIEY